MEKISTIGLDLAKSVFQVHGAAACGETVLRKRLRRAQVLGFFAELAPCVVAMEACAGAHYWGRELARFGHEVKLIPAQYVKPYVKRQKNDAADAEAICEAAQRPTMRFVAVKSAAQQGAAVAFRARDLLVRQRTQLINALRGHLTEYGVVAAKGPAHMRALRGMIEQAPPEARAALALLADMLAEIETKIAALDAELKARVAEDEAARRLVTMPGVGPVIAAALVALSPPPQNFNCGRDFAAWMGLTPRQHSSGGREKLGRTTKMGERSLRRLLIVGAGSIVRWAVRKPPQAGSWLARMLARKPRQLVLVALANKMARIAWALMAHGGVYRASNAPA
ncbi:MAG: IS110 family transposase [Hyphomonadaceae bacterium]|nr:IS110 family transposase [Hyphomonadaceae bacterium]